MDHVNVVLQVALAGPAHGPHAVHHRRLDLDEALAPIALHGPPCCALGQRRGDRVIGRMSKGDAKHLRALDPGRAVGLNDILVLSKVLPRAHSRRDQGVLWQMSAWVAPEGFERVADCARANTAPVQQR